MGKRFYLFVMAMLFGVLVVASPLSADGVSAKADDSACWGQATAVFAATGEMGKHASQEETPRLGLRNLARALYEAGFIPDDTMQSLGAYVAPLGIDACE